MKKQDRTPTIMFNEFISKQLTKRRSSKIACTESLPNYFQSVTKKVFCCVQYKSGYFPSISPVFFQS